MNRLLRNSINRLSKLQSALERVRDRAQKRQDAWLKRREHEIKAFKKAAFKIRDRAVDFIGEWVEIEGVTKSSNFEVRAHEQGWGVFEKGGKGVPVGTFGKKNEAIDEGKRLARLRGGHVDVFTKHGSVQSTFTYQPA